MIFILLIYIPLSDLASHGVLSGMPLNLCLPYLSHIKQGMAMFFVKRNFNRHSFQPVCRHFYG